MSIHTTGDAVPSLVRVGQDVPVYAEMVQLTILRSNRKTRTEIGLDPNW